MQECQWLSSRTAALDVEKMHDLYLKDCTIECLLLMWWTAPHQRHRNVPIRDGDGPAVRALLAFAEWPLLAEAVEELC